ncbi:SMI1/KNR4 family protein [Actinokineospora iranica]|uniref:Knr4/Smi1-like domain-containing protein n=1 Tax=Actinokineospora iranica TaxID=1271860 RepID=A0A1G6XXC2_9PSEU|nr:hypothetical protein [Actinokineospora iranica]SDD82672.1 hypothetical protein SAMN05216174_11944 [Actinokineospora iranica]
MRVVLAIFLVGGLVIALALSVGIVRDRDAAQPTPTAETPTGAAGCEGPVTLTQPPPDVAARLTLAWDRVDGWLLRHAPATSAAWNRAATDADLVTLQRDIGVMLPPELVATLKRHNGTRSGGFTLPPSYDLLSVRDILATVGTACDTAQGRYVPVARDATALLFLDEQGLGQYPEEGPLEPLPATLTDLVEQTADLLDGKGPLAGRYRADVDAVGILRWTRT